MTPSLTDAVETLGLGDAVVGVMRYDPTSTQPGRATVDPRNAAAIAALKPTHILTTESPSMPVPEALVRLSETHGVVLGRYRYPESLADVVDDLVGPMKPGESAPLGELLGVPKRAIAEAESIRLAMQRRSDGHASPAIQPRVLMVIGGALGSGAGLRASGHGTVHHEMLELAGGVNALGPERGPAPLLVRENLIGLNPEVILIFDPGGAVLQESATDPRVEAFSNLPISAAASGRIHVLSSRSVLIPGPRAVRDTTDAMRRALARANH